MTKKQLGFESPVSIAVAANATTPNPGMPGVMVWSSTTSSILTWDGSKWAAPASGGGVTTAINCRLASTANISSLSTTTTVDTIALVTADLVLVKNQTTDTENGVYSFNGTGLVRAASMAAAAVLTPGLLITVSEGMANFDSIWMLTTNGAPAVGTDTLIFSTLGGNTTGTATINFGSFPGANEASIAVTGLTGILTTSIVSVYVMADDTTSDHTASDHRYLNVFAKFTCGAPTAGTGFTIYGLSQEKMQGTFKLRWTWTN